MNETNLQVRLRRRPVGEPVPEDFELVDVPAPVPGPGEVLVRLAASGVNPSDWKARGGSRPMAAPRVIPHNDSVAR